MAELAESNATQPLTVSEVTRRIKSLLEANIGTLWVSGEVSNFRRQMPAGHCYFTLKDAGAQLRAVMFNNVARSVRFDIKDGIEVVAHGRITVYEPYGQHQIVVHRLEPLGKGAQQLALEQLKAKLELEGLFDPARKKPLPLIPRRIGIVTSPAGAAVRDMLNVLDRRFPNVEVMVFPCRVQGEGAAREIRDAIASADRWQGIDVMIIGRGGGSAEDLDVFNQEEVARAIVACKAPVVSAVGHEINVTISDLVADRRAVTPSAAAEMVVPVKAELLADLAQHRARLSQALSNRVQIARHRLDGLRDSAALRRPVDRVQQLQQSIDVDAERLQRAMEGLPRAWKERLAGLAGRLRTLAPTGRVRDERRRLGDLARMLATSISSTVASARERHGALAGRLEALSPLKVLDRGYSITRNLRTGEIVRKQGDVKEGDLLQTRVEKANVRSRVEGADPLSKD